MFEDFRLRVFKTVCELGSFTAAARELGVTQPAVSQNITELERQLGGIRLLERGPAAVRVTEDGQKFLRYAEEILHWYEVARDVMEGRIDPPEAPQIELPGGRQASVWSCGGDIHIHFDDD